MANEMKPCEEAALTRTEELYRALYHENPSMYFTVNSEGTVVSVNKFGAEQLGYTPEELIGQPVLKVVHPDDHADTLNHIRQCAATIGHVSCWEFRKVRKDGQIMWVKEVAHTVTGPDDTLQILIVCEDVTELKRTEDRLRMQQAVLEQIAVGAPLGSVIDLLCRWIEKFLPGAVCGVMTLDRQGLLSLAFGPSMTPEMRKVFVGLRPEPGMGSCAIATLTGQPVIVEDTAASPHWERALDIADRFNIRACWSIPIFSNDRKVVGTFPICHDHPNEPDDFEMKLLETASHLAGIALQRDRDERALRESEQRVLDILDNSPAVVQLKDLEGQFLLTNKQHASMFGMTRSEIVGRSVFDVHSESVAKKLQENDRAVFTSGRAMEFEESVPCTEGERTYLSIKFPLRDTAGQTYAVCGISTDITERKRAERAIREKNAQLSLLQVVASAANEAGSPEVVFQRVLDEVCAFTGWPVGHVYRVDPGASEEGLLRPTELWHLEDSSCFSVFRQVTQQTCFRFNEGLPGRVLASGKPAWIVDVREDPNFPRARAAEDIGVRAAFGFPVLVGSEVTAVLEFFSGESKEPDEALLSVMAQVGTLLGRVIERQRSDAALRESEGRYRSAFDHAPVGIAHIAVDGQIVRANPRWCAILKRNVEDLIGSVCLDLAHPEDRESCGIALGDLMMGKTSVFNDEKRMVQSDGGVVWVHVTVAPVKLPGGEIQYLVCIIEDITHRKQSETALRESEARFRQLVEHAADAFYVHDLDGRIVDVNHSACRQLGYSRDELLNMSVWDIETSFSQESGRALWKEFLDTTDMPVRFESTLKRRDGKTIPVEVSLGSITSSGQPMMLALARDITERRRAEQEKVTLQSQLHQAEKMKAIGTLASGVAHDFNNYLIAIHGCAELAKKAIGNDSPAAESLGMIERMSKQAMGLSDSLLTFARKSTTEKSPVELTELVGESVRLLRRLLPNTIQLNHEAGEHAGGGAWVLGHRISLQQVLMNLSLNARDAMPNGGRLRVFIEQHNDPEGPRGEVSLSVEDTGVGMAPEVMARVFEPFFTTKERGDGTGLGLSVVHGIVTDHRGKIEVESQEGNGTKFTVRLPTCDPPRKDRQHPKGPASKGHELIVLAEENDYVREIMASSLESAGYTVVVAGNARSAVEEVKNHGTRARLLVLDAHLLNGNGVSCLETIWQLEPCLPVMLVREPAGQNGALPETLGTPGTSGGCATEVLTRPFQMSELLETVGSLLEKSLTTGVSS